MGARTRWELRLRRFDGRGLRCELCSPLARLHRSDEPDGPFEIEALREALQICQATLGQDVVRQQEAVGRHDADAPSAVAGDQYLASGWYKSTAPTRFIFWYRDANGGWHYWTQSPQFAAAGSWTQATWGTPAVHRARVLAAL